MDTVLHRDDEHLNENTLAQHKPQEKATSCMKTKYPEAFQSLTLMQYNLVHITFICRVYGRLE